MNKSELIDRLAAATESTKSDAGRFLEAFLETVGDALKAGDSVTLVGFGAFVVRARAARNARNPQTGLTIEVPAAKVPAFKPGASLKAKVNGG